jgi:hypothetical protein
MRPKKPSLKNHIFERAAHTRRTKREREKEREKERERF